MTQESITIAAPFFEDFERGMEFDAPAVTLTEGLADLRRAIVGDRLRLPLDHHASREVTGVEAALAHPLLVTDVAIGQSTWASQRAKANLFYRGLVLLRPVHLGETLHTTTRIVRLRQNRPQPGRPATGLVALEVRTRNQDDHEVLHFHRCAMVPCRESDAQTDQRDALDDLGVEALEPRVLAAIPTHWNWDRSASWSGRRAVDLKRGMHFRIEARDTVTSAPELVRATLNMAMMHTDERLSYLDRRLVYGGHTIGVAFAQVTRALPNLLILLGWERLEHLAPVIEGDRLRSELRIASIDPCPAGSVLKLEVRTHSDRGEAGGEQAVLDWSFWAISA